MYLIFLCLLLKKVALLFCPSEALFSSALPDIFKDFSGLINKIPGLSRTAKKIQDFSRMWQP